VRSIRNSRPSVPAATSTSSSPTTNQYNLYDPKGRSKKDTSYFFYRDKTGACEVYRFAKGDEPKKQGALPMDYSPYRSVIEDSYKGWKLDESVKNRPTQVK
jgi:hypothetical protein